MTEEKLAHHAISEKARSLLWGMLYGAAAVTLLGMLLVRPLRISVEPSPAPSPPAPASTREEASSGRVPSNSSAGAELSGPGAEAIEPEAGQDLTEQDSPDAAAPAAPLDDLGIDTTNPPTPDSAGTLRVSNQTIHAVRIALLPQETAIAAPPAPPNSAAANSDPARNLARNLEFSEAVHWDFAPGEGSLDGLLLSLPDGQQTIQAGDILVAFAQDGSQRYWGPYVVGVTSLPVRQAGSSEWRLTLQVPGRTAPAE
ncbi:MAG: hypothetical protein ACFB5Z_07495 [Elainellaceae cyanobacterium]